MASVNHTVLDASEFKVVQQALRNKTSAKGSLTIYHNRYKLENLQKQLYNVTWHVNSKVPYITLEDVFKLIKDDPNKISRGRIVFTLWGVWELVVHKKMPGDQLQQLQPLFLDACTAFYEEFNRGFSMVLIERYIFMWKNSFNEQYLDITFTKWPVDPLIQQLPAYEVKIIPEVHRTFAYDYNKIANVLARAKLTAKDVRAAEDAKIALLLKSRSEALAQIEARKNRKVITEGLEWDIFGYLGVDKMRKSEYLKHFAEHPKLQDFLRESLASHKQTDYVSQDTITIVVYGNKPALERLLSYENIRRTLYPLMSSRLMGRKLRTSKFIPEELFEVYSELFNEKISDSTVRTLVKNFWDNETIQNFALAYLQHWIYVELDQKLRALGVTTLRQLDISDAVVPGIGNAASEKFSRNTVTYLNSNTLVLLYHHLALTTDQVTAKDEVVEQILAKIDTTDYHQVFRSVLIIRLSALLGTSRESISENYDDFIMSNRTEVHYEILRLLRSRLKSKSHGYLIRYARNHNIPLDASLAVQHRRRTGVLGKQVGAAVRADRLDRTYEWLDEMRSRVTDFVIANNLYADLEITQERLGTPKILEDKLSTLPPSRIIQLAYRYKLFRDPTIQLQRTKSFRVDSTVKEWKAMKWLPQIRLQVQQVFREYLMTSKEVIANDKTISHVLPEVDEMEIVKYILNVRNSDTFIKSIVPKIGTDEELLSEAKHKVALWHATIVSPVDIARIKHSLQMEKYLRDSKVITTSNTSTDVGVDIEQLLYNKSFIPPSQQMSDILGCETSQDYYNRQKAILTTYLDILSIIMFIIEKKCFEWAAAQSSSFKRQMISSIIEDRMISPLYLPELVGSDYKAALAADLAYYRTIIARYIIFLNTVKIAYGEYKEKLPELCTPITTDIPLTYLRFRYGCDRLLMYDLRKLYIGTQINLNDMNIYKSGHYITQLCTAGDELFFTNLQTNEVYSGRLVDGTLQVTLYMSSIVYYYRNDEVEVWLYNDGELCIDGATYDTQVIDVLCSATDCVYVVQQPTGNQMMMHLIWDGGKKNIIPDHPFTYYTDGNRIYLHYTVETVIPSCAERLFHWSNSYEYTRDLRVVVAVQNDRRVLRQVVTTGSVEYDMVGWHVYNGYLTMDSRYVKDQTSFSDVQVVALPERVKYGYYPQKWNTNCIYICDSAESSLPGGEYNRELAYHQEQQLPSSQRYRYRQPSTEEQPLKPKPSGKQRRVHFDIPEVTPHQQFLDMAREQQKAKDLDETTVGKRVVNAPVIVAPENDDTPVHPYGDLARDRSDRSSLIPKSKGMVPKRLDGEPVPLVRPQDRLRTQTPVDFHPSTTPATVITQPPGQPQLALEFATDRQRQLSSQSVVELPTPQSLQRRVVVRRHQRTKLPPAGLPEIPDVKLPPSQQKPKPRPTSSASLYPDLSNEYASLNMPMTTNIPKRRRAPIFKRTSTADNVNVQNELDTLAQLHPSRAPPILPPSQFVPELDPNPQLPEDEDDRFSEYDDLRSRKVPSQLPSKSRITLPLGIVDENIRASVQPQASDDEDDFEYDVPPSSSAPRDKHLEELEDIEAMESQAMSRQIEQDNTKRRETVLTSLNPDEEIVKHREQLVELLAKRMKKTSEYVDDNFDTIVRDHKQVVFGELIRLLDSQLDTQQPQSTPNLKTPEQQRQALLTRIVNSFNTGDYIDEMKLTLSVRLARRLKLPREEVVEDFDNIVDTYPTEVNEEVRKVMGARLADKSLDQLRAFAIQHNISID